MAEATATVRKRAVAASPKKAAARAARPARATRKPAPAALEDEAPITNYALRLTEQDTAAEEVWVPPVRPRKDVKPIAPEPEESFDARMSEALRAIRKAQGLPDESETTRRGFSFGAWLKALDKLPPIRLPVGPSVPWRVGLPAMIALVAVMFLVSRPTTSRADTPLPAQETYEVQQAPLFSHTDDPPAPAPTPAPLGVPEPAGASFDFMDVGFKLVAVLALAYGSLMLLKRAGLGGSGANGSGPLQGMKIVSSLALAPNRSVHVIRVPGGRTLLVGATPNAVNLLADLGVLDEEETPEASTFIDALKGKLG